MPEIKLKRAYDPAEPDDGYRIYVDRIWPRGLSHETFVYDLWDKEIAPSTELRHWFHEDPDNRWPEFKRDYLAELEKNPNSRALRQDINSRDVVTLLFSSKDEARNNAVVLREFLMAK